jgi:long-chain acyl-CoA synthetase
MALVGTVGVAATYTEIRLEEVPEMGYDPLGNPSRGEICIRGKTVFTGYYKNPELTSEAIVDGWFHTGGEPTNQTRSFFYVQTRRFRYSFRITWSDPLLFSGDIGEMTPDGILKVIDRKKNIFKLSQGEYVAVEYLEKIYGFPPLIEDVSEKNPMHISPDWFNRVLAQILYCCFHPSHRSGYMGIASDQV